MSVLIKSLIRLEGKRPVPIVDVDIQFKMTSQYISSL